MSRTPFSGQDIDGTGAADEPDDRGSAALEFVFVGLILLVPLVYLIVALGTVQGQALGVETGARQLARTLAAAPDADAARTHAERVIDAVATEYGLDRGGLGVTITCSGTLPDCPAPGVMLTVTVRASAGLPLVPPVLGLDRLARVPVEATSVQKVSRFWGSAR